MNKDFLLYEKLAFLKRYNLKFLFIAFCGIHIPLLGIITYMSFFGKGAMAPLHMVLLTLVLTLVATALTLFLLNELLKPLKFVRSELEQYLQYQKFPDLPIHFNDEIGTLMASMQVTLEQLQRLLDEKKDMIALLSHDLRSPINQISSMADILKYSYEKDDPQQEYIQTIETLCTQHSSLLDDLLALLKQEETKLSAEQFQETDISALLEVCIQDQQNNLKAKDLTICLEDEIKGISLMAEQRLFRQAIQNILQNAIKFSYPGNKIEIKVSTREEYLLIEIKDYGLGFEPSVASELFDRFTQHGRKGTHKEPSTGLGLHLTKKIIEQHKGQIEAYSAGPEEGSTFTITLTQWQRQKVIAV